MAKLFIGGEWVDSKNKKTIEIRNPATGEVVDTAPEGTAQDADQAVEAAEKAFKEWSAMAPDARGKILFKAAELIAAHKQEIGVLLTKEQGKPVSEAVREIEHFLHGLEYYAGVATKIRGAHVPLSQPGLQGIVLKQPIGVCGAIVAWNYPLTLMGRKISPALVAGNTVIVKPARTTPLATLKCMEFFAEAGLPKGVLNVVTGPGNVVGEALVRHPKVRRVGFTGETQTGKRLMAAASEQIKPLTLELGGSDPMIVCDDADLKRATTAASIGRFYNCGQSCLAVKRLYLFESIAEAFIQELITKVQRLKIGNGLQEDVRIGPLHTARQREEVEAQVQDAVKRGAKILTGGKRPEGAEYQKGFFYLPTLLTNVAEDSRIVREECFGPALPIFRVKDLDEAIAKANDSIYGLGASIWTKDLAKAMKAAEKLEAGNVWINSLHIGFDEMPFGGVKQSGLGREHGLEVLEYYLETKGVVLGI